MSLQSLFIRIQALETQLRGIVTDTKPPFFHEPRPGAEKPSNRPLTPDDAPSWAQELAKACDHVSTSVRELSNQLSGSSGYSGQSGSRNDIGSPTETSPNEHPGRVTSTEHERPRARETAGRDDDAIRVSRIAERGDAVHSEHDGPSRGPRDYALRPQAKELLTSISDATAMAEAVLSPEAGSFCLNASDMGEGLIPGLARFVAERSFGKITVTGLAQTDWPALTGSIQPPEGHDLLQVEHVPDPRDGLSCLMLSTSRRFQLPDFTQSVQEPSLADCEQFLDDLIRSPPKGRIPYYVGPTTAFGDLLHPGAELQEPRLGHLSGINEHWCHVGAARSGTAFHREDAGFRSCNLTLFGWKLWLLVRPTQTEKFDAFVQRLGGNADSQPCDQFVRHQALLVTPARLRREGIAFDMCLTGPGTMMVTAPRQYHYVVNMTASFAIAINFLLPGEIALPPGLTVCTDCGLFPLREAFPEIKLVAGPSNPLRSKDEAQGHTQCAPPKKRKRMHRQTATAHLSARHLEVLPIPRSPTGPGTRSRRPGATPHDDASLSEWLVHIERYDPCYRSPSRQEATLGPKLLRVFYACRGSSAVEGLVDVVEGWRQQEPSEWELLATYRAAAQCFSKLARLIDRFEHRRRLHSLLGVLLKLELADYVDKTCAREKMEAADWDKVWAGLLTADHQPLDSVRRNRKLSEWRNVGRKMRRFPFELLCLAPTVKAPPYHVNYSTLISFTDHEVSRLVTALRADRRGGHFLRAAAPLVESLLQGRDLPEFKWEGPQAPKVTTISDDEALFGWVAPLPCLALCVYNPDRFRDTAKPESWPGDWPADPTTGDGFDRQCDFCTARRCACRDLALSEPASEGGYFPPSQQGRGPVGLVLRACGAKGQGIFVRGPGGGVVFEKGRTLGEFTGEIVPPGSYDATTNQNMVLNVEREDLPGEPLVYQIYYGEVGNWTRKINHQCRNPTAVLRAGMLSGRYSVRVLASRDLKNGEEVTVKYSTGSLSFTCRCEDCDPIDSS